ncbi:HAMP domain-containing protein [Rhodobacteraceae bacterium NNCM2]|nr:HAMP domain-containing protein [Coraliihabitans acroporae]
MRRRLHLQIYLTILACLALVVVLSSAFWIGIGRDRSERDLIGVAERLAALTLPSVETAAADQADAASRLADALRAELALLNPQGEIIFATKRMARSAARASDTDEWRRRADGFAGSLLLEDGRSLIVAPPRRHRGRPLLGLVAFIAIVGLAVGVGAYPYTRRLTRRLEALQTGVERFGSGDLDARVEVEGRDEVAALADAFNRSAAAIERLVAGRRLLLANTSHELRTPLARIRLGIELLEQRPDPARFVALKQDLAEIDELIETLLLSSRIDAMPEIDRSETVDLLALAVEEAARYEDCEVEGTAPEVAGDAALLRRMLRNLLDNAYAHGAPPVLATLAAEPGFVRISVADHGDGFPQGAVEAAFEPFYRGPGRQNVHGFGLGLAIVQQIAEAHGGSVSIEPSAKGAVVTVRLPLRDG